MGVLVGMGRMSFGGCEGRKRDGKYSGGGSKGQIVECVMDYILELLF